MGEKDGMVRLGLAGIRVLVDVVNSDILTKAFAGYEDSRLSLSTPEIRVKITPEDIEAQREQMLSLWAEEGIEIPNANDAFYEFACLLPKILEEAVLHRVIYMHGSAVSLNGQGYLFTAPSGTGKSTHARLWREQFGDEVVMINDDKPLLRFTEDEIYLCGSPWNGKHGLGCPMEAPLRGIVRLRRGEINEIEPMSQAEAVKELYLRTYRFKDREKMQIVMELIGRIVEKVPCYSLRCNMEPEAAEVARRGVTGVSFL